MQSIKKYNPSFAATGILCLLLVVLFPNYQYYVDPDATAYLTISKYYAAGDLVRAVNGYWSPWSCWVVALFIKAGLTDLSSMVLANALGATGFIFISQSLFLKFDLAKKLQWVLNVTLALFLCYAVFWQSFDDIWECFFLLLALRLLLSDAFGQRPVLWVLTGAVGALAYFAKAYAFPFFILNIVCCSWFAYRQHWFKISVVSTLVMVACCSFWIFVLHNKYGTWTTSTAGSLNMSWYLVGHPHWKEGIQYLIPPHYSNSPSYWEDPWYANGDRPQFWSSAALFGRQLLKGGYNFLKFILSILQLSVFFPLIVWMAIKLLRVKNNVASSKLMQMIAMSFLLFPLAYMLINFEPRYIWYMLPLALLMAGLWLQKKYGGKKQLFDFAAIVFAASFLVVPLLGMKKMYNEGKDQYDLAQQFKAGGVSGSFTSNAKPGIETQRMQRLAYFSGLTYYYPRPDSKLEDVQKDMERYHVKYYFYICKRPLDNFALADRYGFPYKLVYASGAMKIFELTQDSNNN